jgi:hypothetical protein
MRARARRFITFPQRLVSCHTRDVFSTTINLGGAHVQGVEKIDIIADKLP